MKTLSLWLVEGRTGQWSDHRTWVVAACISEASAKRLENACHDWARAVGISKDDEEPIIHYNQPNNFDLRQSIEDAVANGFLPDAPDQFLQCDYTGVDYIAYRVDLRIHNPDEWTEFADSLMGIRSAG